MGCPECGGTNSTMTSTGDMTDEWGGEYFTVTVQCDDCGCIISEYDEYYE